MVLVEPRPDLGGRQAQKRAPAFEVLASRGMYNTMQLLVSSDSTYQWGILRPERGGEGCRLSQLYLARSSSTALRYLSVIETKSSKESCFGWYLGEDLHENVHGSKHQRCCHDNRPMEPNRA